MTEVTALSMGGSIRPRPMLVKLQPAIFGMLAAANTRKNLH
jgi:hypothetical protein